MSMRGRGRSSRGGGSSSIRAVDAGDEVASGSTSMTLNERFALAERRWQERPRNEKDARKSVQTTFQAIIPSNNGLKAGNKRSRSEVKPPQARQQSQPQKRAKKGGPASKAQEKDNKKSTARPPKKSTMSKEDLDKELDLMMGRDPAESRREHLNADMDDYWAKHKKEASKTVEST